MLTIGKQCRCAPQPYCTCLCPILCSDPSFSRPHLCAAAAASPTALSVISRTCKGVEGKGGFGVGSG